MPYYLALFRMPSMALTSPRASGLPITSIISSAVIRA